MPEIQWEDAPPAKSAGGEIQWETDEQQAREFNASLPDGSTGYTKGKKYNPKDSWANYNKLPERIKDTPKEKKSGKDYSIEWETPVKDVPKNKPAEKYPEQSSNPLGLLDFGANLVSGVVGAAAGGLAGVGDLIANRDLEHAQGASQAVSEALTWEPRTEHGKALAQGLQHALEAVKGASGDAAVNVGRVITGDKSWDPAMQSIGEAFPDVAMTAGMLPGKPRAPLAAGEPRVAEAPPKEVADIQAPDVPIWNAKPERPYQSEVVPGSPEAALQPDVPLQGTPEVSLPYRPSEALHKAQMEEGLGREVPYEEARKSYEEVYPSNLYADKPRIKLGEEQPKPATTTTEYESVPTGWRGVEGGRENVPTRAPSFVREVTKNTKQFQRGWIDADKFAENVSDALKAKEESKYLESPKERARGVEHVKARLYSEAHKGTISTEMADFTSWLIDKNPNIAKDLGISVRLGGADTKARGSYNAENRIISIFHDNWPTPEVGVHELLHHSSGYFSADIARGLQKEWLSTIGKIAEKLPDERKPIAIRGKDGKIQAVQMTPREAAAWMVDNVMDPTPAKYKINQQLAVSGIFGDQYMGRGGYHLTDPNEFFAVRGTDILSKRWEAGTWQAKAKQFIVEMIQKIKGTFKGISDKPVLKALEAIYKDTLGDTHHPQLLSRKVIGGLESIGKEMAELKKESKDYDEFIQNVQMRYGPEKLEDANAWWTKQVQDQAAKDTKTQQGKQLAVSNIPGLRNTRTEVGTLEGVLKNDLFDKNAIPRFKDISKPTRNITGRLEKPDFFATRNPFLRWVVDKTNAVDHNASFNADQLIWGTKWDRRGVLGTSKLARDPNVGLTAAVRLPFKEQAQLAEALIAYEAEVKGSPTGPYRSLSKLSSKQLEAVQNYRDMMDKSYQVLKDSVNYFKGKHPQAAKELDLDGIYRDGAYIPHTWLGDYRWEVRDAGGKKVATHGTSGATATIDKMGLSKRYPKDYKFELVASEDYVPGFKGHLEERMPQEMGGWEGSEGGKAGAKALWNASELYVRQISRQAEMLRLRADLLDLTGDTPAAKALEKHYPNSLDWSKDYISKKLFSKEYGVVEDVLKALNSVTHTPLVGLPKDTLGKTVGFGNNVFLAMKLGFNPRSWFGNTVGPITQVHPFLLQEAARMGIKDKSIADWAMLKGAQDFFTAFSRRNDAIRYGYEAGALHPKFVEALDYEKTSAHTWADLKNKWGETAYHMATGKSIAGTTEEWGRGLAYLTAVNFYEKAGLKGDAAYKAASEATNMWVGRYGAHQQPQMVAGSPLLGKALSPLHTFAHTYFASTGEFVRAAKEKGEFRPLLNHLGWVSAMGGMSGMIGVGMGDEIADLLNEHAGANIPRPSTAIIKQAEKYKKDLSGVIGDRQMDKFVDSYVYGVPAAWMDWNVSESLSYPSLTDIPEAGGLGQLSETITKGVPTALSMATGGTPSPASKYRAAVAVSPTIIRRATIDPYFAKEYLLKPPMPGRGAPAPKFSGFPQPVVEGDDLLAGVLLDAKDVERTKYMVDPLHVKQQKDKYYAMTKENQAISARVEKLAAKNYNLLRAGKNIDMDAAREIGELTGQLGKEQTAKLIKRIELLYSDKQHRLQFGPDGKMTLNEKLKARRSEELWPKQ